VGVDAAELRLSYRPDDEWHGQLEAAVVSAPFSGRSSAWFTRQHLKEDFIVALRKFPLSGSEPPMIESGFASKDKPRTLEQCHLRIVIRPYDGRGSLLVYVDLSSESWTTPDKDFQQSVIARFPVEYAAIDTFATHLEEVLDGKREEAVLSGVIG
jgi:hypothetical protein